MTGKRIGGRPKALTQALKDEICARIMDGETLNSICKNARMPAARTVYRILADEREAEFRHQYARAKEIQLSEMLDELLEIADDRRNDWIARRGPNGEIVGWRINVEHIQRSKIRIETRKWMITKRAPKRHGSQVEQVDHSTDSPSTRRDLTYRY